METDINAAETKQAQLKLLLKQLNRVAVAFSGGIDSAFLLKTASEVLRGNVTAITVESPLFPKREALEAAEFCRNEGVRRETVSLTEEDFSVFAGNPPERCYLCKRLMFEKIRTAAAALDLGTVCEGTNADDENDYRPGLKALTEAGIRSPLLECGLTKNEIRFLARRAGMAQWNKASSACSASRIPYGETITVEKLRMIEEAETYLFGLGIDRCRVRLHGGCLARIECDPSDWRLLAERREEAVTRLKQIGFVYVSVDWEGFRSGSLNEVLKNGQRL